MFDDGNVRTWNQETQKIPKTYILIYSLVGNEL